MNLRLLAERNLGIGSAANFLLGAALYGCVYLLPQYLAIVQNYDAFQTGEVMIWVGIPQLLVFPLLPRLMKQFDLRALVCFGALIFAGSCWMNTYLSHDYGGTQFLASSIIRALGQPFTLLGLRAKSYAAKKRE